jgi:RNA 2',3'-cyclic 3'-phosphodiesterase
MNLRLFIAIDIPEQIRKAIGELLDILKKYDADVKWIPPENIHLTLKFLGSTPDSIVTRIQEALLPLVSSYEPFYITIRSTGVFPNKKYPRVIWIGIVDSDILKELRDRIENAMSLLGFQREDKAFHPHLTLGRVQAQRGMISLMGELELFHDRQFGTFRVDQVKLMKSELKPKGAEYRCLHTIPFGVQDAG